MHRSRAIAAATFKNNKYSTYLRNTRRLTKVFIIYAQRKYKRPSCERTASPAVCQSAFYAPAMEAAQSLQRPLSAGGANTAQTPLRFPTIAAQTAACCLRRWPRTMKIDPPLTRKFYININRATSGSSFVDSEESSVERRRPFL